MGMLQDAVVHLRQLEMEHSKLRQMKESFAVMIWNTRRSMSLAAISLRKIPSLKEIKGLIDQLEKQEKDF